MFNPNFKLPPQQGFQQNQQQGPASQKRNLIDNMKQVAQKTKEKATQIPQGVPATYASVDTGSPGWWLFGFFLPFLGFAVYLCWRKYRPLTAHKTIVGSFIGMCVLMLIVAMGATMFGVIFLYMLAISAFRYG